MRKRPALLYTAIIAVCFFYTGSAYMSQFYRLMGLFDGAAVDEITSGWNYLCQAAGIGLFCLGLRKDPKRFGDKRLFAALLLTGAVFMLASQLARTGTIAALAGYVFNVHIGLYFGFYLSMLAQNIPPERAGLCYGAAYALGSVGTYLLSLWGDGAFLVSRGAAGLYAALALMTAALVWQAEDIDPSAPGVSAGEKAPLRYLLPLIAVMTAVSVVGSGLYYSLPQAAAVNWNLIRAFYALGLVLAGFVADRSRLAGELCTAASLVYPLIAMALIGEGVANTAALGMSYAFRGFLSVYYVIALTDLGAQDPARLCFAPLGLLVSRVTEAVLSLILVGVAVPEVVQLAFSALCFLPITALLFLRLRVKYVKPPVSDEQRLAAFADAWGLTARESEVLCCLAAGMSDDEIAEKCFISRSTVRFHVSNLLKKTGTASRVEVVRALERS